MHPEPSRIIQEGRICMQYLQKPHRGPASSDVADVSDDADITSMGASWNKAGQQAASEFRPGRPSEHGATNHQNYEGPNFAKNERVTAPAASSAGFRFTGGTHPVIDHKFLRFQAASCGF